ncbi:hypothetical protein V490_01062 [Pseudogymnoascus sp. VKM F-3557]|nr:hypothetical protein V490_01062 [Pseudogymnoascus sp. VKM F-3557]
MSQITPQVDIGNLTLNGLTAFAPILAALSADDVAPLAMVQMENLGALFLVNGKYALKVPDLLRRCQSTVMERLSLHIGWRKGDAASLMAQSAGGQAISLLSMCIINLYDPEDMESLLIDLSKRMLPHSIALSSPSQLIKVANILGSKLQALGFTNILNSQVDRICNAYENLGRRVPCDLFDKIPPESMAGLLHALTRAVREESIVVRITGSNGMGHILAILMIMFPEDTLITVESEVIFQGLRKSILAEFTDTKAMTSFQVESKLEIQSMVPILPIARHNAGSNTRPPYCDTWPKCMSTMLGLTFKEAGLEFGVKRPEALHALRVACCNMFEPLLKTMGSADKRPTRRYPSFENKGITKLLGLYPRTRINQVCQTIWDIPNGWQEEELSLTKAFVNLASAFATVTSGMRCHCDGKHARSNFQIEYPGLFHDEVSVDSFDDHKMYPTYGCLPRYGWRDKLDQSKMRSCTIYRLWEAVGEAIGCGFICLLVNAGDDATIQHPKNDLSHSNLLLPAISALLDPGPKLIVYDYIDIIHKCAMSLFKSPDDNIACSSNSSTVYMAALEGLQLPNAMAAPFMLTDGRLIFNGRYHTNLVATKSQERQRAQTQIHAYEGGQQIVPSSDGEHSNLMITILERTGALQLTTTVQPGPWPALGVAIEKIYPLPRGAAGVAYPSARATRAVAVAGAGAGDDGDDGEDEGSGIFAVPSLVPPVTTTSE